MTLKRARSPFVWLRRILLVLGLGSVLGVGLLLAGAWFGKAGTVRPPDAAAVDTGDDTRERGTDFTFTQFGPGGEPLFRIRADKSRQDRADNVFLDGVALDVYRQDGSSIAIAGKSAVFHREAGSAELDGDVVLRGWDHLEMRARALRLQAEGQVLTSEGAVELRYPPDLVGRASSFTVDRRNDSITLAGGVHLRSVPEAAVAVRLDCDRLVYRQQEGQLRAHGDVFLERGEHQLQARAVTVFSNDGLRTIEALRARFDVRGTIVRASSEGEAPVRIAYQGELLEVESEGGAPTPSEPEAVGEAEEPTGEPTGEPAAELEQEQPAADADTGAEALSAGGTGRRILLRAPNRGLTTVTIQEPSGLERTLTGRRLIGQLDAASRLVSVAGDGSPLELVERQAGPKADAEAGAGAGAAAGTGAASGETHVVRQASARSGRADFLPDGRIGAVVLRGEVQLADDQIQLTGGDEATFDFGTGGLTVSGDAVELFDPRGRVVAPRFVYQRDRGLLRAEEGVQAQLDSKAAAGFAGTPLGDGRGPLRVASNEAIWTTDPQTFVFRGSARAWRGPNLLLADQIRGDQTHGQLAASGGVATTWIPEPVSGGAPSVPIEVNAEQLSYREAGRELVYETDVVVTQGRRTLSCTRLNVELEEQGSRAKRMLCHQNVRLVDAEGGRQVLGDEAVYTLARELVEVYGEKVRLFDAENNELVGKYLQYDVAAGTVQLRSQPPESDLAGASPR